MSDRICIHQFAPTVATGDGVTHSAFYVQKLLRRLGYQSGIYSHRPPFELRDNVDDMHLFDDRSCHLLLVHHSMGHDLDQWLTRLRCPIILVYHNITPPEYFPEGSGPYFFAKKGLSQLKAWADMCAGAIGVSELNTTALNDLGYKNVVTLPLLVDFDSLAGTAPRPPWADVCATRSVLLSVGRLAPNKRQDLLVDAMGYLLRLRPAGPRPLLFLAGNANESFGETVRRRIRHWGLEKDVVISGLIEDGHLRWLYQHSCLYWCASEHEGFCMPLIEAQYHRLPVVAFSSSNIPDTLGESGLIIDDPDPRLIAATTAHLLETETERQTLQSSGDRNVRRYDENTLLRQLKTYLQTFDHQVAADRDRTGRYDETR
ncbi:MAG: hypothetical protein CMK32_11950 [Porticoccaceae bacterium]|nr:hypothetical protein [Porticoccaceae bacterium]